MLWSAGQTQLWLRSACTRVDQQKAVLSVRIPAVHHVANIFVSTQRSLNANAREVFQQNCRFHIDSLAHCCRRASDEIDTSRCRLHRKYHLRPATFDQDFSVARVDSRNRCIRPGHNAAASMDDIFRAVIGQWPRHLCSWCRIALFSLEEAEATTMVFLFILELRQRAGASGSFDLI